jgi:2-polyprenyl-3-methyl-5-hydroxy-6-metoxy-1,4-benzoquinol methylase
MPVHHHLPKEGMIYQRAQYAKGGAGRRYWDYRDDIVFSNILPHHGSILDIGCGEGIALQKLIGRFPEKEVLGVDLEHENIEICAEHGLRAVLCDLCEMAIPDARFDVCIMIDVLEHLNRPEVGARELHRVLTPGGRLIVVVPNDRNFFLSRLALGMVKEAFYDAGHERQWRPADVGRLLRGAGFGIVTERSVPFFFWQTSLHHITVAEKRGEEKRD